MGSSAEFRLPAAVPNDGRLHMVVGVDPALTEQLCAFVAAAGFHPSVRAGATRDEIDLGDLTREEVGKVNRLLEHWPPMPAVVHPPQGGRDQADDQDGLRRRRG
jgi:hypothetical protein